MKKVLYLIVREDLGSSLIQSQAIDLLKNQKNLDITLFWFYGLEKLFSKHYIQQRKKLLKGCAFKSFSCPFLSYRFPVPWWQIPLVFLLPTVFLAIYVRHKKIDVIHARSYNAGLIALLVKKITGVSFIFDPRSPYPEEQTTLKYWGVNSLNYKVWKFIETKLVNNADTILVVSEEFKRLYRNIDATRHFLYLPNNYPLAFEENQKNAIRIKEVAKPPSIEIVYLGSLGLKWNNYKTYIDFMSSLKGTITSFSFTMITPQISHKKIKTYALNKNLDIIVTECSQKDVPKLLEKYTAGIYLMEKEDPRLGVKTVEYLFCGLPVIVSKNITGATKILAQEKLGFVVSDNFEKTQLLDFLKDVSCNRDFWRNKCNRFAKENFSPKVSEDKLNTLYKST